MPVHYEDVIDQAVGLSFEFTFRGEANQSIWKRIQIPIWLLFTWKEARTVKDSVLFEHEGLSISL